MGAPGGSLRGVQLGLGGILREGLACRANNSVRVSLVRSHLLKKNRQRTRVLEHGGLQDEQASSIDAHGHATELLLNGVQRGDGLIEGTALVSVGSGTVCWN